MHFHYLLAKLKNYIIYMKKTLTTKTACATIHFTCRWRGYLFVRPFRRGSNSNREATSVVRLLALWQIKQGGAA